MYLSRIVKQAIIMSVMCGGLIMVPAFYSPNINLAMPLISVAHAEVRMYTGVGEDYSNQYESQEIAKQRAYQNAIKNATEQAGVYLQTYAQSINGNLSNDEISAIMSNSYEVVGDVKYDKTLNQLSNTVTIIVWKATVKVNIDNAEVRAWLNRDAQIRANIVNQNNAAVQAAAENDRKIKDLRKRAETATTDSERTAIQAEYEQADNEFLLNQKFKEGNQLYYQQNYSGAIAKYTEILQINPNYANVYYNCGNVYADLKN
ncbi:MAG: tetratricopeptide repeat protein, partial [Selenomonadaceae bacterium]|nr:tetratricopeptide repeat protein [Selenomonadaceae bacterium]